MLPGSSAQPIRLDNWAQQKPREENQDYLPRGLGLQLPTQLLGLLLHKNLHLVGEGKGWLGSEGSEGLITDYGKKQFPKSHQKLLPLSTSP